MTKEQKRSMNITDVSFIIPTKNTLNYTLMAYRSLRELYPLNEIVMLDDKSEDGTWDWIYEQAKLDDSLKIYQNTSSAIVGHTVLYDLGVKMSKTPLVSIFHSDMIASKGYLENMLKHWKPKTVVCSTRVEPSGIYPEGKEKILKPFGKEFHEFDKEAFTKFCAEEILEKKDQTTLGMFAPWLISKEDFLFVGGHDAKSFAPYPHEDFDIFLRWKLAGYNLIQSRDSLNYHFISKGHRSWAKNGVGKDDNMFQFYNNRASRNYIRKWHKWMSHDEYRMPNTHPVYNVGFVVGGVENPDFIHFLEPWCSNIFVDNWEMAEKYMSTEQPTTKIDLKPRIRKHEEIDSVNNDILLYFNYKDFISNPKWNPQVITNLTEMISDGVEDDSEFEYGIFKLKTKKINDISQKLIKL
jgi:GT2 family glycosyltransferase